MRQEVLPVTNTKKLVSITDNMPMTDKNTDKEPKRRRRMTQFQDVPPAVRRTVTEFLQPTVMQQATLRSSHSMMATDRKILNELKQAEDDPLFQEMVQRQLNISTSHYHTNLQKYTKTPGIWETYRYFWDDSKPFPDQGPNTGGGQGPITT